VTLKTLLRLLPEKKTRIEGTIRVAGRDVLALSERELADHRGGVVSMIFQDPGLALDPVYTIGRQIAETVVRHEGVTMAEGRKRARSRCSSGCASRRRSGGSRTIRTRCRGGCGSGR
jgi:peptide/nickel transport system ATP-binding protein